MMDNMVVEAYDCTPDATFYVDLDFNVVNPTSGSFVLYINGVFYSGYQYSELPLIEVGPFMANGSTYTFLVMDENNGMCQAEFELESEDCGDGPCYLTDLYAEPLPCTSTGEFYVEVGLEYGNVGNDGFTLFGNGNNYGTFDYDDLPVVIGPFNGDGATEFEVVAVDENNPDCTSNYAVFGPIDCSNGACQLTELTAEIVAITSNYVAYVIDFNHVNTGGLGFDVFFENEFIGFYPYNELPVEIQIACNTAVVGTLTVCDNDNLNCCTSVDLELPPCNVNCYIGELEVDVHPCDDNGLFNLDLDFPYVGPGGEFMIQGNGVVYGMWSYDDLPITIGPLVGDGTTFYEFVAIDLQDPNCSNYIELGPIECDDLPCEIQEVTYDIQEVGPNGYLLEIDVVAVGTNSSGVDVYFNNEYLGFYNYNNIPFNLELPCMTTQVGILTICASDNPNCCLEVEIEFPPCTDDCILFDPEWTFGDCTAGGHVFAELNFNYSNVGADGFEVEIDGEVYGPFEYAELPLTFGPFPGDGQSGYDVLIYDLVYADCALEFDFTVPECDMGDCIEFEEIDAGTNFSVINGSMPGELVYEEDDVLVSLTNMVGPDGLVVFGSLTYDEAPAIFSGFQSAVGNLQFHDDIATEFDFTNLNNEVIALSLDFAYEQYLNLSVNGYTLQITNDIASLAGMIAPGVNLEVVIDQNASPVQGTLFLHWPDRNHLNWGANLWN